MTRNVQFQVLRGTFANLQLLQKSQTPLQLGELYFTTDQHNLYVGIPTVGNGYVEFTHSANISTTIQQAIDNIEQELQEMI